MRTRSLLLVAGLAFLPAAAPLAAQAAPGVLVIRYFKCSPEAAGVEMLNRGQPIVEELIAEGQLIDYGLARHSWGDEWNVVDYWIAADLPAFQAAFNEVLRRFRERSAGQPTPEGQRPFNEICTAHKDNIYALVAPAAEGLAGSDGGPDGDGDPER